MKQSNNKLIILDRDGVINYDSKNYIRSPQEWIPIPGSLEAISQLKKAGYKVAVATNQSGIGRGYYSLDTLNAMHLKMQKLLTAYGANMKVDYICCCLHKPDDHCSCRKPKPGMLLEIAKYFSVNPEDVIFVGDKASDQKAAESAKMQFVLVKTAYVDSINVDTATAIMTATKREPQVYESLAAWVNACKF